MLRQRLGDAGEELGAVAKVKDATLRENAMLREDLERARMDGQVRNPTPTTPTPAQEPACRHVIG